MDPIYIITLDDFHQYDGGGSDIKFITLDFELAKRKLQEFGSKLEKPLREGKLTENDEWIGYVGEYTTYGYSLTQYFLDEECY